MTLGKIANPYKGQNSRHCELSIRKTIRQSDDKKTIAKPQFMQCHFSDIIHSSSGDLILTGCEQIIIIIFFLHEYGQMLFDCLPDLLFDKTQSKHEQWLVLSSFGQVALENFHFQTFCEVLLLAILCKD